MLISLNPVLHYLVNLHHSYFPLDFLFRQKQSNDLGQVLGARTTSHVKFSVLPLLLLTPLAFSKRPFPPTDTVIGIVGYCGLTPTFRIKMLLLSSG